LATRFTPPAVVVLALLGCTLVPSTGWADAAADAKDLFARGRELRTRGDCATAVGLFRKAYELYPDGLGSLRNLAECEESLGHFASARRTWLDLKRALLTLPDRKYEGWDQDATDAAARLAPKLASVTLEVSVVGPGGEPRPNAAVDVTLDGEKLAPSLMGTALDRDPGVHVVRVTGEHLRDAAERTVQLGAGEAKHVALRVVVVEAVEPPNPAPVPPPLPVHETAESTPAREAPPADHSSDARRTVAWVALGVGGASLIGAGISLGVRQSALGTINAQCPPYTGCNPSLRPTDSTGKTASTLFDVLGVAGLVGVGGGVVLLLTAGPSSQARLVVTPTLGGASAAWRF